MDPRRSPGWFLSDDAKDQFSQFFAYAFLSSFGPMAPELCSVLLEPRSMTSDDGLRLNKDQRVLSSRPKRPQDHTK
jgi:hypothetical protein